MGRETPCSSASGIYFGTLLVCALARRSTLPGVELLLAALNANGNPAALPIR
jgi:hypothetical protein